MKEEWTQEDVSRFNDMEPSEYMNVVALAGGNIQRPEPDGLVAARIIAHKDEEISTLLDLNARMAQQLQDELDAADERRPDLEALLEECDRVQVVGGAL